MSHALCNIFATHSLQYVAGTEVRNRRRLPVFGRFDDAFFQAPKTTIAVKVSITHSKQLFCSANIPLSGNCWYSLLNDIGIHRLTVQNVNTRNVDFSKTKYAVLAERLAQKVALYIDVDELQLDQLHYLRTIAHM